MSWYKFEYRHGPGHQSRTVHYEYFSGGDVDDESLVDESHYFADQYSLDNWLCTPVKVDEPPEKEKAALIEKYQSQLSTAKFMLKVLGEPEFL